MRTAYLILLMLACLMVGVVIGATLFGVVRFTYKIGGGAATLTPNDITLSLGTLTLNESVVVLDPYYLAQISTTGVEIVHTLAGDLDVFDRFDIELWYYKESNLVGTAKLSLTNAEATFTVAKGTYNLHIQYSYHVKPAVDRTLGTVSIQFSYK